MDEQKRFLQTSPLSTMVGLPSDYCLPVTFTSHLSHCWLDALITLMLHKVIMVMPSARVSYRKRMVKYW